MGRKSYNDTPSLYIIPTPIGNFEDITYRAIKILQLVDIVYCEDTRVTKKLLNKYEINKKLVSIHDYNEDRMKEKVREHLDEGYNIGLVSDRGTPIISDPGHKLSTYIIENGYNVISLPGATAFVPALTSSGLSPAPFLFYGFLSNKVSKKRGELELLKELPYTLIFYEAPHRLIETLKIMHTIFGDRRVSISREISKRYEEIYHGRLSNILKEFDKVKGELVIVVDGCSSIPSYSHLTVVEHVNLYIKEGYDEKEAMKLVAKDRNISKREIYKDYHMR